jgi:hypothetical protein
MFAFGFDMFTPYSSYVLSHFWRFLVLIGGGRGFRLGQKPQTKQKISSDIIVRFSLRF